MSKKSTTGRAIADAAIDAVEKVRQRPEIAAAMRADATLEGRMLAAARDAASAAAAAEHKRCAAVVALCAKLDQPDQALAAINSGKAPAEVEEELRKKAIDAGWNRAIGSQQPVQGAPAAGWEAVVAKVNGGSRD